MTLLLKEWLKESLKSKKFVLIIYIVHQIKKNAEKNVAKVRYFFNLKDCYNDCW